MSLPYKPSALKFAKHLRKNMTPQEKKLWYQCLAKSPIRFQRQKAIGSYIADFYCHRAKLVVEVDGTQHNAPEEQIRDSIRTDRLEEYGLTVVRIPNSVIDRDFSYAVAFLGDLLNQIELQNQQQIFSTHRK